MDELASIIHSLKSSKKTTSLILATLVAAKGSSYRRIGARALLLNDGTTLGMISGGCLEADLIEKAQKAVSTNKPYTIRYDSTDSEDSPFGLGLGCKGIVDVMIEPLSSIETDNYKSHYLTHLGFLRNNNQPCALATVYGPTECPEMGSHMILTENINNLSKIKIIDFGTWRNGVRKFVVQELKQALTKKKSTSKIINFLDEKIQILVETIEPPIALTICGAGIDAQPLTEIASVLGWSSIVYDHRASLVTKGRFPKALEVICGSPEEFNNKTQERPQEIIILMTHNYSSDIAYLQQFASRNFDYLGILGPRKRTNRLIEKLGNKAPPVNLIYGPTGLDIGAETPQEIALSIIAEIYTVIRNRSGKPLRERQFPIHMNTRS